MNLFKMPKRLVRIMCTALVLTTCVPPTPVLAASTKQALAYNTLLHLIDFTDGELDGTHQDINVNQLPKDLKTINLADIYSAAEIDPSYAAMLDAGMTEVARDGTSLKADYIAKALTDYPKVKAPSGFKDSFDTTTGIEALKSGTQPSTIYEFALTNKDRLTQLFAAAKEGKAYDKLSPATRNYCSKFPEFNQSTVLPFFDKTNIYGLNDGDAAMDFMSNKTNKMVAVALVAALGEWNLYAKNMREDLAQSQKFDKQQKEVLKAVTECYQAYGSYSKAISHGYTTGSPSLKDLAEKANVSVSGDGTPEADDSTSDNSPVTITIDRAYSEGQALAPFFDASKVGTDISDSGKSAWDWFQAEQSSTPLAFTDNYKKGVAYSAGYIPMQTNVYSPDTLETYKDDSFLLDFHYKYGFMRKALLIDKSATSVQDFYNAKGKNTKNLQVCTLRDLLNAKGDVTLYLDTNFYNKDKLEAAITGLCDNHDNMRSDLYDLIEKRVDLARDDDNKDDPNLLDAVKDLFAVDKIKKQNVTDMLYLKSIEPLALVNAGDSQYNPYDMHVALEDDDAIKMYSAANLAKDSHLMIDDATLKTNGASTYNVQLRSQLATLTSKFLDIALACNISPMNGGNYIADSDGALLHDNWDSYVFPSSMLQAFVNGQVTRSEINSIQEGSEASNNVEPGSATEVQTNYVDYTTYAEYTPAISYAVVSAIYRDPKLFAIFQDSSNIPPIFMASEGLDRQMVDNGSEVSATLQNTIYNYALLKNLKSNIRMDYTYSLDLNNPVFCDIYGNILTASGTVVIPAMANATLFSADWAQQQPALGLYSCYGNDYYIPSELKTANQLDTLFEVDKDRMAVRSRVYDGIDFAFMNLYGDDARDSAVDLAASYLSTEDSSITASSKMNWWLFGNIIVETMRGAPMGNIDQAAEGIGNTELDLQGMTMAAKLEKLVSDLKGVLQNNSLFVIPDFTRMEHVEYYIALATKVFTAIAVLLAIVNTYRDAVGQTLSIKTVGSYLFSIVLVIGTIIIVPTVFQLSYYGANKALLQDAAVKIAMTSTEKIATGVEVGMTSTDTPASDSGLMVRLDTLQVPWYEYAFAMFDNSALDGVTAAHEAAKSDSLIAGNGDVTVYNDGVYMPIADIFNSADVNYSFDNMVIGGSDVNNADSTDSLYITVNNHTQTLGYYSPYFVFLNQLVANVNDFNSEYDTFKYTTKYGKGTRLKTVGVCSEYFRSVNFMQRDHEDGTDDIFNLKAIYRSPLSDNSIPTSDVYSDTDINKMHKAYWYNSNVSGNNLDKRILALNQYARDFIAANQSLATRVSDDTFLKVMALSCAMKYNQLFGVPYADAYELYNVDSADIIRLGIAPMEDAMISSPLSYGRFVYEYGGIVGVYGAAVLTMVLWLGAFIKPLCTIIVFLSMFCSVFVYGIILRRKQDWLGYIMTVLLISATNVAHALVLKFTLVLPDFGIATAGCLILMIVLQVLYLVFLGYVTGVSLRCWDDLGSAHYRELNARVKATMHGNYKDKFNKNVPHYKNNWDYYDDMQKRLRE